MTTYRYYTKGRQPMPGAIPMLDTLTDACPFEERTQTPLGWVWGYADYSAPLTGDQVSDYELTEVVELR